MRAVVRVTLRPGQHQMQVTLPDEWFDWSEDDRADWIVDEAEDLMWDATQFHVNVINNDEDDE